MSQHSASALQAVQWRNEFRLHVLKWISTIVGFLFVSSVLVYYFESSNENASIRTYPLAVWYTLVTISTVGYGDLYPVTAAGRMVGVLTIVFSLGYAGYAIGRIQSHVIENNRRKYLGMYGTEFQDHYIVVGWNPVSLTVIRELLSAGFRVAILSLKESDLSEIDTTFHSNKKVFKTFGSYDDPDIYDRLGLERSSGVILVCLDDSKTLITSLHLRKKNPHVHIIAHIENAQLKSTIQNAGVTYVVSTHEIIGRMLASAAFEPDVGIILEDLLSTTETDDDYDVQEYRLGTSTLFDHQTFSDASRNLASSGAGRLLAYSRNVNGRWTIRKNPAPDETLEAGDFIIVIVNRKEADTLSNIMGLERQGRRS